MTFKKFALLLGVAILPALHAVAQQQIGAIATPQINSTFYVGTITGFLPTIQSAVTAACATSGAAVDIPAGSTPSDTIAAVTGGCTTAGIIDHRVIPAVSYALVGGVYVAQGGSGGGLGPVTLTGTAAANFVPCAQSSTAAVWCQLSADQILPGFTINSFTGGSAVEIGATVTSPAFTASYSSTPTCASITNTDGIGSPHALTTPFTSGTVTGAFVHATAVSTTFTLTAVSTSTQTRTSLISWEPRTFGGVGAPSATASVSASGTTAVLSNGAVLASAGLNNAVTYGPFIPSAQKIYILMIGGAHTFKDAVTGFAFAFNTPTSVSFVNVNGAAVTMFLYESTNALSGTFSIQVVS